MVHYVQSSFSAGTRCVHIWIVFGEKPLLTYAVRTKNCENNLVLEVNHFCRRVCHLRAKNVKLKCSLNEKLLHLQSGMSVELVEEVHQQVDLQGADAQHHVLLCLRPVPAVVPAQLLAFHPQVREFLKLTKCEIRTTNYWSVIFVFSLSLQIQQTLHQISSDLRLKTPLIRFHTSCPLTPATGICYPKKDKS